MNRYYVMTILKDKGGKGDAWRCAASEPCLSKNEALELIGNYRKNWDCLAAWIQLFEDDSKNFRIIHSECSLDKFGKYEEALRMTHEEAQKIFSAYCNGTEYPFGETDRDGLRTVKDWKEAERHAKLLDEAIQKQIPRKPMKKRMLMGDRVMGFQFLCPACQTNIFRILGMSNYCCDCGQKIDWSEYLGGEESSGRSD